jgi:hypothetical protein
MFSFSKTKRSFFMRQSIYGDGSSKERIKIYIISFTSLSIDGNACMNRFSSNTDVFFFYYKSFIISSFVHVSDLSFRIKRTRYYLLFVTSHMYDDHRCIINKVYIGSDFFFIIRRTLIDWWFISIKPKKIHVYKYTGNTDRYFCVYLFCSP